MLLMVAVIITEYNIIKILSVDIILQLRDMNIAAKQNDVEPHAKEKNTLLFVDNMYTFQCPWCFNMIQVAPNELNCKIFRCGVLKQNNQPINPHLPKDQCEYLFNNGLIYGCGKPFLFDGRIVYKCEYI